MTRSPAYGSMRSMEGPLGNALPLAVFRKLVTSRQTFVRRCQWGTVAGSKICALLLPAGVSATYKRPAARRISSGVADWRSPRCGVSALPVFHGPSRRQLLANAAGHEIAVIGQCIWSSSGRAYLALPDIGGDQNEGDDARPTLQLTKEFFTRLRRGSRGLS